MVSQSGHKHSNDRCTQDLLGADCATTLTKFGSRRLVFGFMTSYFRFSSSSCFQIRIVLTRSSPRLTLKMTNSTWSLGLGKNKRGCLTSNDHKALIVIGLTINSNFKNRFGLNSEALESIMTGKRLEEVPLKDNCKTP